MALNNKDVFYVNAFSEKIRFVYDGNPRAYFGKDNEIDHVTNSSGFRGKEFSFSKPKDTFRIAFIGDSFTFGEGVRLEDTYVEKVSAILSEKFKNPGYYSRGLVRCYSFFIVSEATSMARRPHFSQ